jgi:hypothetical protein
MKNFKIKYQDKNQKELFTSIIKAHNLKDATNCAEYHLKIYNKDLITYTITEL